MMKSTFYLCFLWLIFTACNSDDPSTINPYDSQKIESGDAIVTSDTLPIDANTIQGLHQNIFKPTCANSGCHDGNFEPDFRTIESAYNTLVNQPLIKNDDMNPLTARVTPGNAATSMLMKRLTIDLNNNSGIMPLVTEPGSDWHQKKDAYIKNVETWINNGALNQTGKASTAQNFPVQLVGLNAMVGGNLATRYGTYEPIDISVGTSNVEIWVAFSDDALSSDALTGATINTSLDANKFDPVSAINLQYTSSPITEKGFYGTNEKHYFKATIPTSAYKKNDVIWIRTEISDGVNQSELPNNNSLFRAKKYAAIRIK